MINFDNVTYKYKTFKKKEGFSGAIQDLFSRKYEYTVGVKNCSFNIRKGEIIGLLGPNGAGKSTIIKLLTGILTDFSGEISCMGFNPAQKKNEYLHDIGCVFGQKSQLIWDLPAMDTLIMLKEIYGLSKSNFEERTKSLLNMLNIVDKKNIPVRKLSLGERMKFELTASLLHNPKILFLDEPTIGLDIRSQIAILNFLKKINKEEKTTIILTSHYTRDIKEICERIIIVIKGEKKADYKIDEFINLYKTPNTYIINTTTEKFEPQIDNAVVKKIDNSRFKVICENENQNLLQHIDLKDIISITEEIPDLEDILYELFSSTGD